MFKGYNFVLRGQGMESTAALISVENGTVRDVPNANSIFVTKSVAVKRFQTNGILIENPTNHWYVRSAWVFDCVSSGEIKVDGDGKIAFRYLTHKEPQSRIMRDDQPRQPKPLSFRSVIAEQPALPLFRSVLDDQPSVKTEPMTPTSPYPVESIPGAPLKLERQVTKSPLTDDDIQMHANMENAKRRRLTFDERKQLPRMPFIDDPITAITDASARIATGGSKARYTVIEDDAMRGMLSRHKHMSNTELAIESRRSVPTLMHRSDASLANHYKKLRKERSEWQLFSSESAGSRSSSSSSSFRN